MDAQRQIERLKYEGQQLAQALHKFGDVRLWSKVDEVEEAMFDGDLYELIWNEPTTPYEFVLDVLESLKEVPPDV
jgi:hypothetical protein